MTILLTLILGLLAAVHLSWGGGIWLPIRDEEQLARTVVGAKGVTRMPGPIPCILVFVGLLAIIAALWLPQMLLARVILWGAGVIFLLRGSVAYTKFWRKMTPEEPFNTYDRRYYAPLCVALGLGLIVVLLRG